MTEANVDSDNRALRVAVRTLSAKLGALLAENAYLAALVEELRHSNEKNVAGDDGRD